MNVVEVNKESTLTLRACELACGFYRVASVSVGSYFKVGELVFRDGEERNTLDSGRITQICDGTWEISGAMNDHTFYRLTPGEEIIFRANL